MIDFLDRYGDMLLRAIFTHLGYVVLSVGIGLVIALVLGVLLSRKPKWSTFILPVLSVFQTIPGLVFIGVLFIYLGIRPATVIIALSVYAFFPILKNTYTALVSVDPGLKEAARGCGMSNWQILRMVELPMATNAIFVGLRIATIYTVSWAILAAMIGLGGLGEFVYRGIDTNNQRLIIGGAIPSAILALSLGYFIDWLNRRLTPRGLKARGSHVDR